MRNILVLGHSHVGAIRLAAVRRRETGAVESRIRTIHVQDPAFGDVGGGQFTVAGMPPLLHDEIKRQIDLHSPLVVSALNGNMHSVIAMVREDRAFDFELSGEPSPRLAPDAVILSEHEVTDRLENMMRVDLGRLTRLQQEFGPFWQIESPPPVAARSFIERRLESFFAEKPEYARNGLSPAGLRYRMWRLSCRITEAHVRALGCNYMPTPRSVLDASGFLSQAFAGDSTHGNIEYGERLILGLETLTRNRPWLHTMKRRMAAFLLR